MEVKRGGGRSATRRGEEGDRLDEHFGHLGFGLMSEKELKEGDGEDDDGSVDAVKERGTKKEVS